MKYADKLQNLLWQKRRLEIFKRDKFRCQLCKDKETMLHLHHIKYTTDLPHEEPAQNLITLCKHCHHEITVLYKTAGLGETKFSDLSILKFIIRDSERVMFVKIKGSNLHIRRLDELDRFIDGFSMSEECLAILNKFIKK